MERFQARDLKEKTISVYWVHLQNAGAPWSGLGVASQTDMITGKASSILPQKSMNFYLS